MNFLWGLGSGCIESDEGSTVSLAEDAHECSKAHTRIPVTAGVFEHDREADRVNAYPSGTVSADFIETIYLIDCSLHVATAVFVSEDIDAYLFIRTIVGVDGRSDTFYRATVAE